MSSVLELGYPSQLGNDEVSLSEAAQAKMAELIGAADGEVEAIRIFVSGGGCSGMTYGMTYVDTIAAHDRVLEGDGFKIVVDPIALNYLQGCDIDFVEDGLKASFVFNNVFRSVGGSGACAGCGGGGF